MGGSADASGFVGRSNHHTRLSVTLSTAMASFNWLPSKLIVPLFVEDCVVLVRNKTARVSRTGTPAAATTVCCCRCRCCAYEDLLANAQAQHQLQRILRCAILAAWNCVSHTVAGALLSICRYHKQENQTGSLYSHMSCLMRVITVHCFTTGTSTILLEYEVQGRSGQTRSGACAFCVVRSHLHRHEST